jgi:hydrogenase expression/formation protein HypC
MCLAIPTRIRSMNGQMAEVEIGGVQRTVSLALTPEARVGDYVIVHTGFAISVLDQEEAEESLRLFAEMAEIEDSESQ